MHQPRTFDVVSITFQLTCPTRPVHLKEEVEVVGFRIQDSVSKDADDITERRFYTNNGFHRHTDPYREHRTDSRHIVARLLRAHLLKTPQ